MGKLNILDDNEVFSIHYCIETTKEKQKHKILIKNENEKYSEPRVNGSQHTSIALDTQIKFRSQTIFILRQCYFVLARIRLGACRGLPIHIQFVRFAFNYVSNHSTHYTCSNDITGLVLHAKKNLFFSVQLFSFSFLNGFSSWVKKKL